VLTRNHRQEALSLAYVQAIAAQAGLSYSIPRPDYGIDISLRTIVERGNRRTDASAQVDIQVRSTTRANVSETQVIHDLDVTTYDDLRDPGVVCPRILVLLVLPVDEAQWLSQSTEELILRKCAYRLSLKGMAATRSTSTVRIGLPVTHVFSVEALQAILQRVQGRIDP
jgi:hypothetical protein